MAIQKIFVDYDLNKNKILNAKMHPITTVDRTAMASTLTTSDEGLMVYDVDLNVLFIWRGDIWLRVTSEIQDIVAGQALSSTNINGIVTLDVNTDNSTIEVVNDAIQVKTTKQTEWDTAYSSRILGVVDPMYFTNGYLGITQAGGGSSGYLWQTDYINFNNAYNNMIVSGSVTGTTTKTLTLNRQYGTALQVSWTDDNTDAVLSVNGLTGAVVLNTDNIAEGAINQYFTAARARLALSAGAGISYDNVTGIIFSTITQYTDALARASISAGTGINYDSVSGVITNSAPDQTVNISSGAGINVVGTYPNFTIDSTITQYTDALARQAISLTTNGTAGQATYINGVFNIPNYTTDLTGYATETYVNTQVSNLVGAAPTTLDTLNELAEALGDDPNFATSITTLIGTKEPAIVAGTTSQYWRGDKTWQTLPTYDLSGYVPYNGANQAVNLGNYNLTIKEIVIGTGAKNNTNIAIGRNVMSYLSGGTGNVGIGVDALYFNGGDGNVVIGYEAGYYMNQGANVMIGYQAGKSNGPASNSIGIGYQALQYNSNGSGNLAIGYQAGNQLNGSNNTIIGGYIGATMSNNVILADGVGNIRYRFDGTNNNFYEKVIFGSTLGNGTYTYNLPSANGTLALFSDIPSLAGYVPTSRTITINGVTYDLTTDRTWTIAGGLPVGGTAGQILSKVDSTDYNAQWINEAPSSSYTSQLKHVVKASVAINKGQAVYVTSADGTNMIVGKASNTSEQTSSKTLGLLETSVSANGFANVITEGLLSGLDTTGANAAGDPVWLGTDGNLIYGLVNKPYAPDHLVFIGVVTRRNANNGEIFVKVQNGFEIQELHNVQITSTPADNTVLAYETSTSLYKMKSISTLLGYTPADDSLVVKLAGNQTVAGIKTFSDSLKADTGFGLKYGSFVSTSGYLNLFSALTVSTYTLNLKNGTSGFESALSFNNTANRNYTFPNADGTIALTSDIPSLSGYVPTSRTLTINGTAYDLSADRSWTITSMIYPGAGIAVSTGSAWGTSITDNSSNWNTAYGWGNHASAGYLTGITSTQVTTALGYTPPSGSGTTNYLAKWTGSTALGNSLMYDNGSAIGINTASPFESSQFKLDVNGGVIIKNTSGTAAQLILIDSNPATGGNNGFVQLSAGGNTSTAYGQWQTYYGTSIASGTLRLQPVGGVVLVGSSTAVTGAGMLQVAGDVNITGAFKINGTAIGSGTTLNGTGFVKANGTTITYDNSTYYLASNPNGYITSSGSITGNAATATSADNIDGWGFVNTGSNSGTSPDTIDSNGISYTFVSLLGQSDGGLYSQRHSTPWQHQIFGDYRTGQIAIRGKNAGTWTGWRTVIDSSNYSSYALPISGGSVSGTVDFGPDSGSNNGIGIRYGNYASGYGRIRFYQDGSNHQTIHSFSAGWQGGTLAGHSSGAININGQNGVTFGSWNAPAMWIDNSGNASFAGSVTITSNLYLANSNFAFGIDKWAGSGGYPGFAFTGGNNRFGFSSSSGVIDVYADGNFYATDSSHIVLHNGNKSSYIDTLYYGGAAHLWTGSDGTRNMGWAYHQNNGTGLHWPNNGWHLYPENANDFWWRSGNSTESTIHFSKAGNAGNYIHNASDNAVGFLSTGRSWILRVTNGGDAYTTSTHYAAGYRGSANVGGTGEATWHPAGIYVGSTQWLYGTQYRNGSTTSGQGWMYLDWNYGHSIVGVYSSVRLQGVWAMGDAYKLSDDGTSAGNLYGLAWSHPNAGGQAGYLTNHGLIHMMYGTAFATISDTIWCRGNITAYSDIRVKENIQVIDNAVEKVKSIRGVTYTRNDIQDTTTRQTGVIAQEVLQVLPEVVSENKANGHYSVAYGNMVGLLIEAIKEQQDQIEVLKKQIDYLVENK